MANANISKEEIKGFIQYEGRVKELFEPFVKSREIKTYRNNIICAPKICRTSFHYFKLLRHIISGIISKIFPF